MRGGTGHRGQWQKATLEPGDSYTLSLDWRWWSSRWPGSEDH